MRYLQPNCPECGERAIGTIEWVPGLCRETINEEGEHVQYDGETELFYDGQTPEPVLLDDAPDRARMSCGDHEWDSAVVDRADAPAPEPDQEHTPGPWRASQSAGNGPGVYGPDGQVVAVTRPNTSRGDYEQGRRQADARLIAAAPELLEAAKLAAETLAAIEDGVDVETLQREGKLPHDARKLRTAIAKARGEQ